MSHHKTPPLGHHRDQAAPDEAELERAADVVALSLISAVAIIALVALAAGLGLVR